MTPEEIIIKAITANMRISTDGRIDCSNILCATCVFYNETCTYNITSDTLAIKGINLRDECAKLIPLCREQHPELFL